MKKKKTSYETTRRCRQLDEFTEVEDEQPKVQ